jgi:hypothetical protein
MKKHTLAEQIKDVSAVYWNVHRGGNIEEMTRTVWFTAYERWLNDRPLMSEEDPSVLEYNP